MAKIEIVVRPEAENDLIEIWSAIALDGFASADRVLDDIATRISQLGEFPKLGPKRPDISVDARALTVDNYLILYRSIGAKVEVVPVVHGARDLTTLL